MSPSLFRTLVAATTLAYAAHATGQPASQSADDSGWHFQVGAVAISAPRFGGSGKQRNLLVPFASARYKDAFVDPIQGLGFQKELAEGLNYSAAIALDLNERKAKDDPRLRGLRDVPVAPALRFGLDFTHERFFASEMVVARLGTENRRGTYSDTDVGYNVLLAGPNALGVGATARLADRKFFDNFYSVTASESATSGLATYKAGSGLVSAGLFVKGFFLLDEKWSAFGRAGISRLRGDAAASPIAFERKQPFLVIGFTRSI